MGRGDANKISGADGGLLTRGLHESNRSRGRSEVGGGVVKGFPLVRSRCRERLLEVTRVIGVIKVIRVIGVVLDCPPVRSKRTKKNLAACARGCARRGLTGQS